MRFSHYAGAGAAALLTLFVARDAAAAGPCDNITGEDNTVPVIYIENGDTQEPMLRRFGKQLMQTAGTKVRILYRSRPTCDLAANWFTGGRTIVAVTPARPIKYIPADPAFDPTDATTAATFTCDIPAATPTVQLSIGATFLSSCGAAFTTAPADTTIVNVNNQAYGFVVPKASDQIAITAEEGYLAFGFATDGGDAKPWIDQSLRWTRGATASTALTTSANVGLTAAQMVAGSNAVAGTTTSQLIVTGVSTAADPQAAIGALGGDLFDANRGILKMLAFKAFKQRYAYYPDSTSTAFDKQNVRDGHYVTWSPTPYLFVHEAGTDVPTDPMVARLYGLLTGATTETDVNGLAAVAQSGLIPQCAMKVQRSFDGGDLSLFSPAAPCGCFYEKSVPSGATACTVCSNDTPCGGGKCRFGYCEAR